MKKIILIVAMAFYTIANGQVHLGVGLADKGYYATGGYSLGHLQIDANWNGTFTSNENKKALSFTAGYTLFKLVTVTPSAGVAFTKAVDFAAYNEDQTGRTGFYPEKKVLPIASVEVGLNPEKYHQHVRWFGIATAVGNTRIYGAGLKILF